MNIRQARKIFRRCRSINTGRPISVPGIPMLELPESYNNRQRIKAINKVCTYAVRFVCRQRKKKTP